jgi:RNase P subunit RPR2
MSLIKCKKCGGFVVEAERSLDRNRPYTEFFCIHCGKRFYFQTKRYLKILDALKIDYSGRLV